MKKRSENYYTVSKKEGEKMSLIPFHHVLFYTNKKTGIVKCFIANKGFTKLKVFEDYKNNVDKSFDVDRRKTKNGWIKYYIPEMDKFVNLSLSFDGMTTYHYCDKDCRYSYTTVEDIEKYIVELEEALKLPKNNETKKQTVESKEIFENENLIF